MIASFYFYSVFEIPFTFLLLLSIVLTHIAVLGLSFTERKNVKKVFLWFGVLSNLVILYLFKFIDFSFEFFNLVFSLQACDSLYRDSVGVVLPVGISFFTLQAMAYVIDVYRKDIPANKSFFSLALFLSFFPQLVAGPIMRAKDLLYQFSEKQSFTIENFKKGIGIVALGFFKKTMLADPASVAVNQVFGNPGSYSTMGLWLGAILFIIQIYGDFSGYSDIAIGTGRIMGFRIPRNFLRPFLADRLSDLWNRWHISLSTWLRDYIYIPLGGSRVNISRYYFNIFITMALSGVWHGSGINFLCWGVFHALFVVIERMVFSVKFIQRFWDKLPRFTKIWYPFSIFVFSGFMFRAQSVSNLGAMDVAMFMMKRALSLTSGIIPDVSLDVWIAVAFLFGIEMIQEKKPGYFDVFFKNPVIYYTSILFVLGYCFLVYALSESSPFVYFQF